MNAKENIWIEVIQQLSNNELPDQQLLDQLSLEERELIEALQADQIIPAAHNLVSKLNEGAAWNKVQADLLPKRLRLFPKLLRYAAVLLLPLSILTAGIIYYKNSQPVELNLAKLQDTDHHKATLILADGTAVELSDQANKQLAQVAGTSITNKDKKLLSYQATGVESSKQIFNKLIVPRGAEYRLALADGTMVVVNSASVLRFPVNIDAADSRNVYLEKGEAYFQVAKNPEKPFVVHANGMDIKVLGTKFNVNTYAENIKTTLVEGHVQIKAGTKSLDLLPNQQAAFDFKSGELSKENVDVEASVAWKDGWMVFERTELKEVMEQLGRWYDYDVVFESEKLKQVHFGGKLRKYNEIGTLLRIIERTGSVRIEVSDHTIYIKEIPKNQ